MSDEKKKAEPKVRPRIDLTHQKYAGIAWCKHGINEEHCGKCKIEEAAKAVVKAAALEAKVIAKAAKRKPKVSSAPISAAI